MIDEEGRALTFGEIAKEVGARWGKLNPRQKGVWESRAEKEKLQLKRRQAAREQQAADLRKGQAGEGQEEEEGVAMTRPGKARALEPKARHQWRRGAADKQRPNFGLKDRDRSREGGIASRHRVDASQNGRSSKIQMRQAQEAKATKATATKAAAAKVAAAREAAQRKRPRPEEGKEGFAAEQEKGAEKGAQRERITM